VDEFERIALNAPPGIARIDSHYQMVSQHVKNAGDLEAAEYWQKKHLEAIDSSRSEIDEFNYILVMSRYYRVGGFLPQMRQDAEGVVREMDLAEEYALALPRRNEVERIAADEMLYPVYESRTKEALWLDDLDLAEERALKTVKLSPYDARAWLHLGQVYCDREDAEQALQAYLRAVRLAPPGREIAWFMAGQCYEQMDELELACDAYLVSLENDPLGVSAAEQLVEVADKLGHSAISRWARSRLEDLAERQEISPEAQPEPYKNFLKPDEKPDDEGLRS
jgi:tetratricopeptide (TPR) repeat protein